jgi:hypothetical protein
VSIESLVPVDALREAWNQGLVLDISRLSMNIIGLNEAYTMLGGSRGNDVCRFMSQSALYCTM